MNVAILGFGVVGSGVAEVISKNADAILENSGTELQLRRILDIRDFENNKFSSLMTKNFDDVLNDEKIDIVADFAGELPSRCAFNPQALVRSITEATLNVLEFMRKVGAKQSGI